MSSIQLSILGKQIRVSLDQQIRRACLVLGEGAAQGRIVDGLVGLVELLAASGVVVSAAEFIVICDGSLHLVLVGLGELA